MSSACPCSFLPFPIPPVPCSTGGRRSLMTGSTYYCPNMGDEQDMVSVGQILSHFTVTRRISGGTFGQVFFGTDGRKEVAIKIESTNTEAPLLEKEASCLRHLNSVYKPENPAESKREPVLEYLDYGETANIRYLVMECAGRNLHDLRKASDGGMFTTRTSLWILFKMMHTMKIVHSHGWLHRDVKPANFCIGRDNPRHLYVIDFGFCRYILNDDGSVQARRPYSRFYGTIRYASVNSHQRQDLSRWDDLVSVFYIAVENVFGQLPWSKCNQMAEIIRLKQNFSLSSLSVGDAEVPPPSLFYLEKVLPHLYQKPELFYVEPNYKEYITTAFNDLVARNFSYKDPLDWEETADMPLEAPEAMDDRVDMNLDVQSLYIY